VQSGRKYLVQKVRTGAVEAERSMGCASVKAALVLKENFPLGLSVTECVELR